MKTAIHPSAQRSDGQTDVEFARSQIEAWKKDGNIEQVAAWGTYCLEEWETRLEDYKTCLEDYKTSCGYAEYWYEAAQ